MLISIAPFLLLILFYVWMFKRQKAAMGGGLFGGGTREPLDPETVRVTFDDVAGIDEVEAEINEVVDFLRNPEKYRRLGLAPKGGPARRGARDGQDAPAHSREAARTSPQRRRHRFSRLH
jgi:ATP-dependent Zn protease